MFSNISKAKIFSDQSDVLKNVIINNEISYYTLPELRFSIDPLVGLKTNQNITNLQICIIINKNTRSEAYGHKTVELVKIKDDLYIFKHPIDLCELKWNDELYIREKICNFVYAIMTPCQNDARKKYSFFDGLEITQKVDCRDEISLDEASTKISDLLQNHDESEIYYIGKCVIDIWKQLNLPKGFIENRWNLVAYCPNISADWDQKFTDDYFYVYLVHPHTSSLSTLLGERFYKCFYKYSP